MKTTHTFKRRFLSILLMVTMLTSTVAQPIAMAVDDPNTPSQMVDMDMTGEEAGDPEQPAEGDPEQTEEGEPEQPAEGDPGQSVDSDPEQAEEGETISSLMDESDPEAKDWIKEHSVVITVGGTEYRSTDKKIPYPEGDKISAMFEWKVQNGLKLPEKYEYSLGDFKLNADYKGGILYDQNGRVVGEWTAVQAATEADQDKLDFTFNDTFRSEYTLERSFWVQLEGTVPLDPPGTGDDDENGFNIGDEWFDLDPQYNAGGVDLTKGMNDCRLDSDGKMSYSATITATVKGYVKNLKLIDQLDSANAANLSLYSMDGLNVKVNGEKLDEAKYNVVYHSAGNWGFDLDFAADMEFQPKDVITVTYTFKMNAASNSFVFPDNNTVNAEGKDMSTGNDIVCTPVSAPFSLGDLNLDLKKDGDRATDNPNQINWTLTIDTGIKAADRASAPSKSQFIAALQNLLKKKYGDVQIKDVTGAGQSSAPIPSTGEDFCGRVLNLSTFEIKDGKWVLVYEYSTMITDSKSVTEYTNEATITDGSNTITSSGPIGIPGYTLDKSAISKTPTVNQAGSVTMPWKIVTRIPGSAANPDFGSFVIVDKPGNDKNHTDWNHRYKEGSIKIYISENPDSYNANNPTFVEDTLPDWLKLTKTSDGGFTLTVTCTGTILTSPTKYLNKYLIIVYDTEVVNSEGENVDLTNNDYKFENTAEIEGKNLTDSDTYSQTTPKPTTPNVAKNSVSVEREEATGDYIFTWLIRVNNMPAVAKDGTENWGDVYSIDLEDILPAGHAFEKDSLVATLYRGTAQDAARVVSSESIPNISKWLSEKLTYNKLDAGDDGKEKVNIKWNAPDGPCPNIGELQAISGSSASQENYYLALQYQSRLVDHSMLFTTDGAKVNFTNTVSGKVNDNEVGKKTVNAQVTPEGFGAKSYDYQSGWVSADYPDEKDWLYTINDNEVSPNMRFTIEINKSRLTAGSTSKGTVHLEDTMGSGLRLIEDSLRLYNNDKQEYEDVTFSYADNMLTMDVPGGTHYTLVYWVEVLGDVGSSLNETHGNSVKLELGDKEASYSQFASGYKFGSAAGAQAAIPFTIQKVDAETNEPVGQKVDEETNEIIDSAEFTLEYGTINSDGTFTTIGVVNPMDDCGLYYSFVPDDNRFQYVFRITETKAPENYLIGDPRYFVFTEYYDGDLSDLPDFVEQRTFDYNYSFPDDHAFTNAVFEGTKQLYRRVWDNANDNGAYTFTLEAVTDGAPMPKTTSVTNTGHTIRFPEIKYTEAGIYKYKITETAVNAAKAPDVSMDPAPVYVTVKVENDPASPTGMTATVHYSRNENDSFEAGEAIFTFINNYEAAETTAQLYAVKRLETDCVGIKGEYTFEFVLSPDENNPEGDPVTDDITKTVTVKTTNWAYTTANIFADKKFTKEGTYTYTLKEKKDSIPGVTYDETTYTVVVKIDLNEDKTGLISKVTVNGAESNTASFGNSYKADETTAELTVNKTFNDNGFELDGNYSFDFVLTSNDGNPEGDPVTDDITKSVTISAPDWSGNTENFFEGLSFTKEGTYTYTLKEKTGSTKGVVYDDTVYTVTVEITLNEAEAKLKSAVKIDGKESNTASFGNSYKADETTADLTVNKTLETNGFGIKNDYTFYFELTSNDGNPAGDPVTDAITKSVTVSAPDWSGKIEDFFAGKKFTKEGTYTYTLKERSGSTNGVTYDDTVYTVTVEITLNEAEAKLESTVKIDGEESNTAGFGNSYKADETTADLTVTKTLETNGFELENDYSFEFILSPDENNPEGDPVTDDITKFVTFNASDRSGNTEDFFEGLSFTKEGTYTYTLTEKTGDINGVTYDDTVYTITVEITLNEETAKLESTVKIDGKESRNADFVNRYNAMETSAILEGSKTLQNDRLAEDMFSFVLEAVTVDAPLPEITEVTNNADGHFEFGIMCYTSAGVYKYTITEKPGNVLNVIYDKTIYDVTVTVTLDEVNAALMTTVKYQVRGGEETESADFVNIHYNSGEDFEVDTSKDNNGDDISSGAPSYDDNSDDINSQASAGKTAGICMILFTITAAAAVIRSKKRKN